MNDDHNARRVFVYQVKLCQEDGTRGSGWSVIIVTDSLDPADLLRVARIEADRKMGEMERWVGLEEVKLLHVGVLDPKIATYGL
jgi:hypothetical protein